MLSLLQIAKENHNGPLYCGFTKNHVISTDVDISEDVVLSKFATINVDRIRSGGYPDYVIDGDRLVGLRPWHERELKKKAYHMQRHELKDHVLGPRKSTTPMYGIYIDVDR